MNSAPFWELRKEFMSKYGMNYAGVDEPAPSDPAAAARAGRRESARAAAVLAAHPAVVDADLRSAA